MGTVMAIIIKRPGVSFTTQGSVYFNSTECRKDHLVSACWAAAAVGGKKFLCHLSIVDFVLFYSRAKGVHRLTGFISTTYINNAARHPSVEEVKTFEADGLARYLGTKHH